MAGLDGSWDARDRKGIVRSASLAHHLYHHHITHSPFRPILYEPDFYHELHYAVRIPVRPWPRALLTWFRLLIVLGVVSLITWLLRYRFLNMYARLPPEPQRKEPQIDLFPDTQDGDSKPGLANYLDEFLSAIKVFGYRE